MIRYYTYYSCGGYKDLFIGSDVDQADASYFIPLLNVWKKSDKPGMAEKIKRAESVQHVKLISKIDNIGFPSECNLMFSHGGYNAIYRTLRDGRTCFCIRDISNNSKDEEGRDIPFNFLFLADGDESINKLDTLALHYLTNESQIKSMIADAISYEPFINGVKFDLSKLTILFASDCEATSCKLVHKNESIDYMIIGSRKQYSTALSEQGIEDYMVNAMIDSAGIFYGAIAYHNEPVIIEEQPANENKINDEGNSSNDVGPIVDKVNSSMITENDVASFVKEETSQSNQETEVELRVCDENLRNEDISELKHTIESSSRIICDSLSSLAIKKDIENLQNVLDKLFCANEDNTKTILKTIKESVVLQNTLPVNVSNKESFAQLWNKKNFMISALMLIVGFILGALIF